MCHFNCKHKVTEIIINIQVILLKWKNVYILEKKFFPLYQDTDILYWEIVLILTSKKYLIITSENTLESYQDTSHNTFITKYVYWR